MTDDNEHGNTVARQCVECGKLKPLYHFEQSFRCCGCRPGMEARKRKFEPRQDMLYRRKQ